MNPSQERKMDILIDDVSAIKKAIGGDPTLGTHGITHRMNEHEGRLGAIDEAIEAYKIERARLVGIAVTSSAFFVGIGSFVVWLIDVFKK